MSEYLRDRIIRVSIGTILSDELYPEKGVPSGGVLAVTCLGLKINELSSCIARAILRALFVDDLAICFGGRSMDTVERHLQQAVNVILGWANMNGFKFAAQICKRGGTTQPPVVGLKVETAMASAEIILELVCPLGTPSFSPGTHDYDRKRHDLIEGVSKCMISRQEAQAQFNEYREAQGSHDEVYTDGNTGT